MRDFFAFRKMIAAQVIQVIFVLGLVGVVIASIAAIANDQPLPGLLLLVFGGLYWRIVCEVFIVLFRMNSSLASINTNIAAMQPAAGGGWTPSAPIADSAQAIERDKSGERPEPAAAPLAPATEPRPAGWYDDSERPGHVRWWDGTAWGMRDDEHPSSG